MLAGIFGVSTSYLLGLDEDADFREGKYIDAFLEFLKEIKENGFDYYDVSLNAVNSDGDYYKKRLSTSVKGKREQNEEG